MDLEKEKKAVIITRKIKLYIDVPPENKEKKNELYRKLYDWQKIAYKAANIAATNLYLQDQVKDLIYLQDDVKIKLADRLKNNDGIFNCSRDNTTYKILSQKFKNELPSSIFSAINQSVFKNYISEKSDYFNGIRSLRNYKANIPIPIRVLSIYNLRYDPEIKNFRFSLFRDEKYHIPFKTYLGRDRSNNKIIIERCIKQEYKICDSLLTLKDGDIFLYLVVKIPIETNNLFLNEAKVKLSFMAPLIVIFNEKEYMFGDKESYIYKRLAIQHGLRRRQSIMKYNTGGRGRKNKTKGVEEFKTKEKNFINTYTHQLSYELVKFCLDNKIGRIKLVDIVQTSEDAKEFPFVIRNWSFGNFRDKLEYKCKKNSIELLYN
ncbi:MAG: IS200/IS605 family element transposase accessory protein TnpB [Bacteroidales bacterium]|nr:MAG: IS200/IS605 family element transposase accessory protein TnpB [Bacteroidales bacterium]